MSYAELHCVSNFSFLRGASHAKELVLRAHELGYRALAITDECSLAGIVRAHEASKQTGLPLIVGAEFRLDDGTRLVALVPTQAAYTQLCRLITGARQRSAKGEYRIERADFETGFTDGLLLWCPQWPALGDSIDLMGPVTWLRDHFQGRSWIAWERCLHPEDESRLSALMTCSNRIGVPLVAAGDVHMHLAKRGDLQDVLTATRHGCTVAEAGHRLFGNHERYLRDMNLLERLYPTSLLEQSLHIAARCTFTLDQLRYEYPHELVPDGLTAIQHLRDLTEQGIIRRWPSGCTAEVRALINKELDLIQEVRYEHYFLTVEDIIRFARSQNILCQGRGSAANSAVCYALGVTEVDPSRMKLLFERFISKERGEPPDIDIDFEHQRREEVIQYIYKKYGRDRAAIAATVTTYRRKSALRDVAKALGFSLDQIDALTKALVRWDGMEAAIDQLQKMGFDLQATTIRHLLRLVDELLGFPRHLGQHVGGFVISHAPLHTLVPVENAAMPDRTIIQWDKDDLDTMGLLKVDVLALGMLSAVSRACALIADYHGKPFSFGDIPAEDSKTYEMISRADTVGVFQVESRAQMTMLPRLKPECFFDLVIEVAIIRPGPIQGGMVHPFLRRRQKLEAVDYPSPELRRVLERTLGVPLFQEQVMSIAMVAAGFSAGEADQVRRSMAAWKRKGGLEKYHEKLVSGMLERGYTSQFAESIYQQILGFSGYGFPESHAASFALITYASCWLKCHQHEAFTAALLNSQPMGFYAPAQLINDARRSGVVFRPVDVMYSDWDCTLEPGPAGRPEVRLGLRLIKGLAEELTKQLIAERAKAPFQSIADAALRARLDRGSRDRLADAGAFAGLTGHRNAARWTATGVELLPGFLYGHAASEPDLELSPPSEAQEVISDYQATGFTLGRYPVAFLRDRLDRLRVLPAERLKSTRNGRKVRIAGIVTHRQKPETASGVIFATIEDETGPANLIIWPKIFEAYREAVLGSRLMMVEGELQSEQGVIHVIARTLTDYSAWLGAIDTRSRDFH